MTTVLTRFRIPVAALIGSVLLACNGPTESDAPEYRITILSGDNQVSPAGSQLPLPLAVRVTDGRDGAVSGVTIHWTVDEKGGLVGAAAVPSVTDGIGMARVNRTLGSTAGAYTTTAAIEGDGGGAVSFTSVATIQGATQIALHPDAHGDGQADTVLATLPAPLRVVVRDHHDEPVEGVVVSWSAIGGGSVPSATSTTDAAGVAEVAYTLGPAARPYTVRASVNGLVGSPVRFTAMANPGNPAVLLAESGDDQFGRTGSPLQEEYAVRLTDAHGNDAAGNFTIEWAVRSGDGSVDPVRSVTEPRSTNAGTLYTASTRHTLGPTEGSHTVMATATGVPGAPQVTFAATAVTELVGVYDPSYYCWWYGNDDSCPEGFEPAQVTVPAGRTVAWKWTTQLEHNITFEDDPAAPISSPTLRSGRHLRTFDEPGTFRYRCTNHSNSFTEGEVGTVTVQ